MTIPHVPDTEQQFETAEKRLRDSPLDLTGEDIIVLGQKDPKLGELATEARAHAQINQPWPLAPTAQPRRVSATAAKLWEKFVMEIVTVGPDDTAEMAHAFKYLDLSGLEPRLQIAMPIVAMLTATNVELRKQVRRITDLESRIRILDQQLKKRMAAVEEKIAPQAKWVGNWQPGIFEAGSIARYRNSIWIAETKSSSEPGAEAAESRAWRLMVKSPRPGRDGRTVVNHFEGDDD